MVVWVPLVAGAIAVAVSQRSALWRWAHDLIGDTPDLTSRRAEQFARSILGKKRTTIVNLLGVPAATVGKDHWYYAVSGRERLALAVQFASERVVAASVIHGTTHGQIVESNVNA